MHGHLGVGRLALEAQVLLQTVAVLYVYLRDDRSGFAYTLTSLAAVLLRTHKNKNKNKSNVKEGVQHLCTIKVTE